MLLLKSSNSCGHNFELDEFQIFYTDGPVNLSRLMNLHARTNKPELKYPPFVARGLRLHRESENLFAEIRRHDVLLHHPYDSYNAVVAFIRAAAEDPQCFPLKQTLYRTSANSPIFQALREAAQTKEVTVVVELMARFDEASNIRSATESGGCRSPGLLWHRRAENTLQAGIAGAA